jgi:type VII secretion protein EccE
VLDGHECAARPLTGDELVEVDRAVLAGLQLTRRPPRWRRLKHLDGYAISFGVSPQDIDSETRAHVLSADTDATVLTIRCVPSLEAPWCRPGCAITAPSDCPKK